RQSRGGVELRVLVRDHVAKEINVLRPRKIAWVLRAADDEMGIRPQARRLYEQRLEDGLTVLGIGPEVRQCSAPCVRPAARLVALRIDAAIERRHPPRAEA